MRKKNVVWAPDGAIYFIPEEFVLCVHGDRQDSPYHVRRHEIPCDYHDREKLAA